jgi:hypothetical protein
VPKASASAGNGADRVRRPGSDDSFPNLCSAGASAAMWVRARRLVGHGKRPPVAVVALAWELAGFVWAAVTQVIPAVHAA